MTHAPLPWVRHLQQTLIDLKAIPLSGYPPAFPWEEVSKKLAGLFSCPDVRVELAQVNLLSADTLFQGFGTQPLSLELELTPLEGQAFLLVGKEEISGLTSLALTSSAINKGFISPSFQEGFYSYLCTKVVSVLNELNAFGDLNLKLSKPNSPPQEEALCIDIKFIHPKHTFFFRLICPPLLHKAFKEHFGQKQPPSFSSALAQQAVITTQICVGQTQLSASDWKRIHVGDFLLLDRCFFDPSTKKGTGFLCLEEVPIMRVRFKEDHLKIVNYATYHEEYPPMDLNTSEPEEDKEFSSPDLGENEEHLWSSEPSKHDAEEEGQISTSQIPLTIVVEAGRIKMSLEELLNLSPGNTLELPVRPEQGVDLTIQGTRVAKAELVKLGDALGVKILKLAP